MKSQFYLWGAAIALPAACVLAAVTTSTLTIQGAPVSRNVILHEGRPYVAVEDIARHLGGELRRERRAGGDAWTISLPQGSRSGKPQPKGSPATTERWAEPTVTERWSEAPKTEQWSSPTKTEQWSKAPKTEQWSKAETTKQWSSPTRTEQWSQPQKTEQWSKPTYTQRRDSLEPVVQGPAKQVDQRLVGAWKLWIPGGFSPDPVQPGQRRTQSFTAGAGYGTLTLAANGSYAWTNGGKTVKGQAKVAKPWFAQQGLAYYLVRNGKTDYLVTYDPKNKGGFSLLMPTGGYIAGGTTTR